MTERLPRKGDRVSVFTMPGGGEWGRVLKRRGTSVTVRFDAGWVGVWNAERVRLVPDERTEPMSEPRLVWLALCRQGEPHRPHAWGWRRFCRGGWDEKWTRQP